MARHASNSERIARAAAEVEAATKEKAAKKAAKAAVPGSAPARKRSSSSKVAIRLKVVWAVGRPGEKPVKTYPYPERPAADAEAVRLGKGCMVLPLKVPME